MIMNIILLYRLIVRLYLNEQPLYVNKCHLVYVLFNILGFIFLSQWLYYLGIRQIVLFDE